MLFCSTLLAWAFVAAPPSIARGPYLQNVSETQATLVFQTDASVPVTLRYGTRAGAWESTATRSSGTTHVFTLQGLRPESKYFYAVDSGGTKLAGGDDFFFRTSPPDKSRAPFRFLAWGDSGTGSTSQIDVAEQMEKVVPPPEFALGLGDLVYDDGEWENYDPHLFEPYAELFPRVTFWPTLGNHDVRTEGGAPYLDAFYLPTQSGAPGRPSNTEKYYSFDHGMAHFVCLDSESSSTSSGSAMYQWAASDIDDARARGKRWIVAFMHHPPYTRGTHSDTTEVRDNLVPMLEAKGVDMVLAGHSHVYERSFLAKDDRVLQNDPDDYTKITSPNGTLYLVSGCGGKTGSGSLDHPLMAESKGDVAGFNMIDVTWEEIRGSFVERDGETTDIFRLRKANDTAPPRVVMAEDVNPHIVKVVFDEPVRPGTSLVGAENPNNYRLLGGSVLSASLSSDRLTVTLTTNALWNGRAYLLRVGGVADRDGNIDSGVDQRAYFVAGDPADAPEGGGSPGSAGVPPGSNWRYFKGTATPPSAWTQRGFSDSSWSRGPAGFGYADGDDETTLSDMLGNYATVYLRTTFSISDPSDVTSLILGMDFDDGFVAYINGVEVARENVPQGQKHDTLATTGHEAGSVESFDLNSFRNALVSGANVLAVEGHNGILDSNDFTLHPELRATLAGGGSVSVIPKAVLDSDVATANGPAWVHFSSERSTDARAPFRRVVWDFGDGTRTADTDVDHLYTQDGLYVVTLIVRDEQFIDAIDRRTIRIHSQGNAPQAWLTASSLRVDAGDRVDFNSSGSSDPDGGPVYVHWNFGDPGSGAANQSNQPGTSHVFNSPGIYDVTLAVTDDEGSTITRIATITVN